jgi:hypothetical protein
MKPIELEAKEYGIKISIANFMNQLSCTLDETIVAFGVQKMNKKYESYEV